MGSPGKLSGGMHTACVQWVSDRDRHEAVPVLPSPTTCSCMPLEMEGNEGEPTISLTCQQHCMYTNIINCRQVYC